MTEDSIKTAVQTAMRFLKASEAIAKRLNNGEDIDHCRKESGALRRASMDLTRALAEMRKRDGAL